MSPGVPDGQAVVLDVAQLQALLAKTFNVGLDVGRGKEPVALVRLRLAKALIGVAEANALAAEAIAIERGTGTEEIAQTLLAIACQPTRRAGTLRRARKLTGQGCRDRRSRRPPPWSSLDR
jgi:UDP-N-acetylmuramyl pentapeptide synthase